MRTLAAELSAYLRRLRSGNMQSRVSSQASGRGELSHEEEAQKKIGLLLSLIFSGTATITVYQFFPSMRENLMEQSVSLLHLKDPMFKRMGATVLAHLATDDERRMKVVEMGGAKELIDMLGTAKDDSTKKEALKALSALSQSDEPLRALYHAGAMSAIGAIPDSLKDADMETYKSSLLKRFQDVR